MVACGYKTQMHAVRLTERQQLALALEQSKQAVQTSSPQLAKQVDELGSSEFGASRHVVEPGSSKDTVTLGARVSSPRNSKSSGTVSQRKELDDEAAADHSLASVSGEHG